MERLHFDRARGAGDEREARRISAGLVRRRAQRIVAALALAFGVATPCGAQSVERDAYSVRERTIEVDLDLERLGVVLRGKGPVTSIGGLLGGAAGLRERLHDLVQVLDPDGEPDRDELIALALSLLDTKEVLHAGMLVTPVGSKHAMLLTHELVVAFDDAASEAEIEALIDAHGLRLVRRSRFARGPWLVAVRAGTGIDALEACHELVAEPLVEYAEPNFVQGVLRTDAPNDPLLLWQWHHRNVGQGGGTRDADVDTLEAWELTRGSADVVIAVLEDGFDAGHPDLAPNLWTDPENGAHGWNFADDDASLEGASGDHESAAHGTAVAGCAAARGDNGIGGAGSCPDCGLMLVRGGNDAFADGEAIRYAAEKGADVIVNSWTYLEGNPIPEPVRSALADVAEHGRGGLGCVILFAVRNEEVDVQAQGDIASLAEVIAVGASTNTDERTTSCGYGPCLSVLGPSRLSQTPNQTEGTLNVTTTDWVGASHGYNDDPALAVAMDKGWMPCAELAETKDFTACFGGTSAATPIVAGVAGLVLSCAPELERAQVKRLLQDTADRVQDSRARYADSNGRSTKQTHGSGRVNALEAVRLVAPRALGGQAGVDLLVRDNRLDWGNTEQPSNVTFERVRGVLGHWKSPDVKIDAPPFAPAPADARAFEAFDDEDPLAGATNRVFVRVRNRGPVAAEDVTVELVWAAGGPTMPPFPEGFWESFPHAAGALDAWRSLGTRPIPVLPYCGPSVAGTAEDTAAVVSFELAAPAAGTYAAPAIGLVAIVSCAADGPSADSRATRVVDDVVPKDNDVALRCALLRGGTPPAPGAWTVVVRNPWDDGAIECRIELVAPSSALLCWEPAAPAAGWEQVLGDPQETNVLGRLFPLAAGDELELRISLPDPAITGPIELRQWREDGGYRSLMGGVVLSR